MRALWACPPTLAGDQVGQFGRTPRWSRQEEQELADLYSAECSSRPTLQAKFELQADGRSQAECLQRDAGRMWAAIAGSLNAKFHNGRTGTTVKQKLYRLPTAAMSCDIERHGLQETRAAKGRNAGCDAGCRAHPWAVETGRGLQSPERRAIFAAG